MSPEDRRRAQDAPIVPPEPGTVADLFAAALPDVEITPSQGAKDVLLLIASKDAHRVLATAKSDPKLHFDFLRSLCGVDFEEQGMEVVYHLYSYEHRHNVTLRAKLAGEPPHIQSASDLWRAAEWHERETAEMFGIVFDGHPDPTPLLLPEDMFDHHPLRKDNPLAPLEEWQGQALGPEMGRAGHIPPGSGIEVAASEESEE